MAAITGLNVFTDNTVILSAPMNANFTNVATVYNVHDIATTAVHGAGTGTLLFTPMVNANTKVSVPTNTVQSVLAAKADGTLIDQDFYISPQYDITTTGTAWTPTRAVAVFERHYRPTYNRYYVAVSRELHLQPRNNI